ncbi:MAG: hypothetical protein JNM17_22795 [Archangium sp.]|nr:hypothetical protein [Archangium sp.]
MDLGIAVGIGVGVAVYAGVIAVIIKLARRSSSSMLDKKQDVVSAGLSAAGAKQGATTPGGLYVGNDVVFSLEGREVITNVRFVSRSYVRANVKVKTQALPWITVYPEEGVDRFGKVIGLNREVQTGDKVFDDKAYIDSLETDDVVRGVLQPNVRDAVLVLLGHGFKVQFSPAGVEAFKVVPAMSQLKDFQSAEAARTLLALSTMLTGVQGTTTRAPGSTKSIVLLLLVFAISTAGFIGAFALNDGLGNSLNGFAAFLLVMCVGALTWALTLLGLAAVVRGQSNAMRWMIISTVLTLLGVPWCGGSFALWLNQRLDSGPTTTQQTTIFKKYSSDSGRSFTVNGWDGVAGRPSIGATRATYEARQVGDTVTLTIHPGAFGLRWVENL